MACSLPSLSSSPQRARSRRARSSPVTHVCAAVGVLAGLLWRPMGLMAGAGLAFLLLGAIFTHLRSGDSGRELTPALLITAIDALYLAVALSS
jgi:DoxX-like family